MILGIEGGGTQTRIAHESDSGEVHFRAFDVSIKFRDTGITAAVARLAGILEEHYDRPAAIALALSGASNADDRSTFQLKLSERLGIPASRIHIETDSAVALTACTASTTTKVLLISGTGSIGIGQDALGTVRTVGGWGPTIGDEGSGRAIGRAALAHLAKVIDGREKATRLSDAMRHAIALTGNELIAYLKSADLQPALFARVVFETESERSTEILEDASHELAKLVQAVLLHIAANSERPKELFLSGSVAKSPEIMQRLKRHLPLMRMTPLEEDAPARTLLAIARALQ
jgi:N-acetylglucosamine kinase-like BadF-type ATPase